MNVIPETRRAHRLDIYLFLLLLSKLTYYTNVSSGSGAGLGGNKMVFYVITVRTF